ERRVLDPGTAADLPHDDRAGRGADPDPEALRAPAAPHFAGGLLQLADDRERAADGPLGVVLACRRRAEEGEDPVTGEVLDVSAEGLHLAHDTRQPLPRGAV